MRDDKREGKRVVYVKEQCYYERVRKIKETEGRGRICERWKERRK